MSQARAVPASRWFIGVLLLAIAVWVLDLAVLRNGIPHPLDDSWEDAVVARRLLAGDWFRTHTLYPPLWSLRDPATLTVPVLVHGPLMPLLMLAPLAAIGPTSVDSIAWMAAAFALLTLVPLFRLAARHFGEPVAAAACALFTLSPQTIAAVDHYGSVVVGACLVTFTLDLLARPSPRPALAGLVAGLAYLTRPETLLALPILVVLARGDRSAVRARVTFIGVFVACAGWWWWHHAAATGSPFFNLTSYLLVSFSSAHPGDGLVRDFGATPDRFPGVLASSLPHLWGKWAHYLPRAVRRLLLSPGEAVGWLAPIGAAVAIARAETRRFALCAAGLVLIPVAAMTLLVSIWLYPVPFLPLNCVAVALGARWLLERLPRWAHRPRAWMGVLAMLAIPSAAIRMKLEERDARMIERWLAADRASLARLAPVGAPHPMFSDTPDFVAWTTGRPTLWLTRDEYLRVFPGGTNARAAPPGLPAHPDPADTWFHVGDPRVAENQRGAPIAIEPRAAP